MKGFEGYLWKRAPRSHDTDKNTLRRLLTPSLKSLYKRRYFSLSPETYILSYYPDERKTETLGINNNEIFVID